MTLRRALTSRTMPLVRWGEHGKKNSGTQKHRPTRVFFLHQQLFRGEQLPPQLPFRMTADSPFSSHEAVRVAWNCGRWVGKPADKAG